MTPGVRGGGDGGGGTGGGGEGLRLGGGGNGGGGDGGGGEGGSGDGGGEGGGGETGGGILQQASLQFAESDFFLCVHSLLHFFFWLPPRHALTTFFRSFFLHVLLSLSAVQSFGDAASVTLPGAG